MYQKYYTEALVLGSREQSENDKFFALYTKDFGLVRARASAVRKETSRMRYALQSVAHVQVALVRGKRGWRIGGASVVKVLGGEEVITFARIARLTLRLVAGEGENQYVFSALAHAHNVLAEGAGDVPAYAELAAGRRATIELVCVARILWGLGHLSHEALETTLFAHTAYAQEHVREAEMLREKLLASVNRAISETHL